MSGILPDLDTQKIKTAALCVSNAMNSEARTMCGQRKNEPAHEIMVLITFATSEGSGAPAHRRSLARAFTVRTHEVWK